ncbi:collagen alpha-1(I) chain-like [Engraulis encrasicolus]|uniref:collagen alpha-1(I) chain-like n=1 Tax=Engraulis encrasicolus TaxID=184585 RepID=UPI002FCE9F6C
MPWRVHKAAISIHILSKQALHWEHHFHLFPRTPHRGRLSEHTLANPATRCLSLDTAPRASLHGFSPHQKPKPKTSASNATFSHLPFSISPPRLTPRLPKPLRKLLLPPDPNPHWGKTGEPPLGPKGPKGAPGAPGRRGASLVSARANHRGAHRETRDPPTPLIRRDKQRQKTGSEGRRSSSPRSGPAPLRIPTRTERFTLETCGDMGTAPGARFTPSPPICKGRQSSPTPPNRGAFQGTGPYPANTPFLGAPPFTKKRNSSGAPAAFSGSVCVYRTGRLAAPISAHSREAPNQASVHPAAPVLRQKGPTWAPHSTPASKPASRLLPIESTLVDDRFDVRTATGHHQVSSAFACPGRVFTILRVLSRALLPTSPMGSGRDGAGGAPDARSAGIPPGPACAGLHLHCAVGARRHPLTRACVRLLGPCFKTGRVGLPLSPQTPSAQRGPIPASGARRRADTDCGQSGPVDSRAGAGGPVRPEEGDARYIVRGPGKRRGGSGGSVKRSAEGGKPLCPRALPGDPEPVAAHRKEDVRPEEADPTGGRSQRRSKPHRRADDRRVESTERTARHPIRYTSERGHALWETALNNPTPGKSGTRGGGRYRPATGLLGLPPIKDSGPPAPAPGELALPCRPLDGPAARSSERGGRGTTPEGQTTLPPPERPSTADGRRQREGFTTGSRAPVHTRADRRLERGRREPTVSNQLRLGGRATEKPRRVLLLGTKDERAPATPQPRKRLGVPIEGKRPSDRRSPGWTGPHSSWIGGAALRQALEWSPGGPIRDLTKPAKRVGTTGGVLARGVSRGRTGGTASPRRASRPAGRRESWRSIDRPGTTGKTGVSRPRSGFGAFREDIRGAAWPPGRPVSSRRRQTGRLGLAQRVSAPSPGEAPPTLGGPGAPRLWPGHPGPGTSSGPRVGPGPGPRPGPPGLPQAPQARVSGSALNPPIGHGPPATT